MIVNILLTLLFGALVGWVASIIMKDSNSLIITILLGIGGAFVGKFIATLLDWSSFSGDFSFEIKTVLLSIAGACLLIFLFRLLFKKK